MSTTVAGPLGWQLLLAAESLRASEEAPDEVVHATTANRSIKRTTNIAFTTCCSNQLLQPARQQTNLLAPYPESNSKNK
jgi:hypothetical protein